MKIERLMFVRKNKYYSLWNDIVNSGTMDIVSSVVMGNKVTILRTNGCTKEFALWIKVQSSYDSEIFNIASAGNSMLVTESIKCIENFVTSEKIVVVLIDSEDFIDEFIDRDLIKVSDYDKETANEHVTIFVLKSSAC